MIRITTTENGKVQGLPAADPRVTSFKGIPFAAPPVGKNRWRAPQPCVDWKGILKAYSFAPISVQDTPGIGDDIYVHEWHVDPEIEMDEDCLYLNIWTNAKTTKDKKPVLVWIFGGAFQWGYSAEMEFDGERLARRGIVVVTMNYRLNVFGFLSHPDLCDTQPDAPANFGNLDQQAALKWVKRNIENFGGDPENITLAGQSAGGGSVLTQLTCMDNEGLFQKAIIESGLIRSPYHDDTVVKPLEPMEKARENGKRFFDYLGVKTLEEARELDALYIRDRYAQYRKEYSFMLPVIDGKLIKTNPLDSYMKGTHLQVPIMAGNTEDEFINAIHAENEEALREKAKEIFGTDSEKFLSFEESRTAQKENVYGAVSGIECTTKSLFLSQNKCPGYYYRFTADIPGADHPGTFHSVDLWFFFETLAKCSRPFTGAHYDLARQMCNYWANFIHCGNPNGLDADGTKMPKWEPYSKQTPCEMIFATQGASPTTAQESLWKQFLIEKISEELKR